MSDFSVTVVVLTYNQDRYIKQCLNSILSQRKLEDLRIWVIDDSSTDKTYEYLEEFTIRYPEVIKVRRNAFNHYSRGLNPSQGIFDSIVSDYVAFCDGDDYWIDDSKIFDQIEILNSNPNLGLVHTDYKVSINQQGQEIIRGRSLAERNKAERMKNGRDLLRGNYIKHSTVLCRRNLVDLKFVEGSTHISGLDALIYLSVGLESEYFYIDRPTVVHRVHNAGIYNGASLVHTDNLKTDFRWYAAANLPKGSLQSEFRRRASLDLLRSKIRESPKYRPIRPIIVLARKAMSKIVLD